MLQVIVLDPYSGSLPRDKKVKIDIYINMDDSHEHYAKWNKLTTKV